MGLTMFNGLWCVLLEKIILCFLEGGKHYINKLSFKVSFIGV